MENLAPNCSGPLLYQRPFRWTLILVVMTKQSQYIDLSKFTA